MIIAPYFDLTLWPPVDITSYHKNSGTNGFVAAFIVGKGKKASWGGYHLMSENWFLDTFKTFNGTKIISFGGESGGELAQCGLTLDELVNEYISVIELYKPNIIDFDIEGQAQTDMTSIKLRNTALLAINELYPNIQIMYTLPVLPTGLVDGLNVIKDAKAHNLDVKRVNIMTMCYGQRVSDMGRAAIQAGAATRAQLDNIGYNNVKVGLTPMIGVNYTAGETFSLKDANTMIAELPSYVDFVSIWSGNRDVSSATASGVAGPSNSGVQQKDYDFIKIIVNAMKGGSENTPTSSTDSAPTPPPKLDVPVTSTPGVTMWNSNTSYNTGDRVKYNEITYVCKQNHGPKECSPASWSVSPDWSSPPTSNPTPVVTPPAPTPNPEPIEVAPTPTPSSNEFKLGTQYFTGDIVKYNGNNYKCVQSHRSQSDWIPSSVRALWAPT